VIKVAMEYLTGKIYNKKPAGAGFLNVPFLIL
jgi:hypothetical protein